MKRYIFDQVWPRLSTLPDDLLDRVYSYEICTHHHDSVVLVYSD